MFRDFKLVKHFIHLGFPGEVAIFISATQEFLHCHIYIHIVLKVSYMYLQVVDVAGINDDE